MTSAAHLGSASTLALPPEGSPAEALAAAGTLDAPESSRSVIRSLLATARTHLRMEVAFVGRFAGGRRWFDYVDADPTAPVVEEGTSHALEDTYCLRVVDGRLPNLMTDAATVEEANALPVTRGLPIGAHLSVPLRGAEGDAFGTLCCFSRTSDPDLRDRDVEVMRMFADLIAPHLLLVLEDERRRREVGGRIRRVIGEGGPRMALQPIVDLATGHRHGFEALARFPREGWDPPTWFAEAEAVGLGPELEAAAISAALELLPLLPHGTFLTVNASAGALCGSREITELLASGGRGSRLVLELAEHGRISDPNLLDHRLRVLREAGVRIAVDDAGSGYAGLERILQLRPEILKLDRSLVHGVAGHPGRRAICLAMASFARLTGTMLVAEGVESAEDLDALRDLDVSHAQGYHLGRPGFPDDVLAG